MAREIRKLNPLFAHLFRQLTEREERILLLAVRGLGNREIASTLGTTEDTVKHQMSMIYDKTGMSNRVELTNWYRDLLEKENSCARSAEQCPAPPRNASQS